MLLSLLCDVLKGEEVGQPSEDFIVIIIFFDNKVRGSLQVGK